MSVWLGKLACIEPIKAVRPKPASIMETVLQLKVEGLVMKDLRMKDMVVATKRKWTRPSTHCLSKMSRLAHVYVLQSD